MFQFVTLPYLYQQLHPPNPLAIQGPRVQWFRPTTLKQLLALRDKYPHTSDKEKPQNRLVVGNTEIGE